MENEISWIYKSRARKNSHNNNNKKLVEFKFYRIIVICDSEQYKYTKILNSRTHLSPGIGVGVFVINSADETILLGRRKDSGLFGLPGGWLELGESWGECASRELVEETGLIKKPDTFSHIHTLNCRILSQCFHSISCIMYIEVEAVDLAKVRNMEPHKCLGWEWVTVELLRKHIDTLFHPLRDFLNKFTIVNKATDLGKMIK